MLSKVRKVRKPTEGWNALLVVLNLATFSCNILFKGGGQYLCPLENCLQGWNLLIPARNGPIFAFDLLFEDGDSCL